MSLKPALLPPVDMHHVHVVRHAVEGIGDRRVGVATDQLASELNLRGLLQDPAILRPYAGGSLCRMLDMAFREHSFHAVG